MIFCAAAYILNRLLLQTKEPTEAAKVKMPTGKTVRQRLDSWWAELEPQCYYFEDDFCDNSHMYLVWAAETSPSSSPKASPSMMTLKAHGLPSALPVITAYCQQ